MNITDPDLSIRRPTDMENLRLQQPPSTPLLTRLVEWLHRLIQRHSLENHLGNRNNNFTLVRLFFASLVLYGHSFALAKSYNKVHDHIQWLIGRGDWAGSVAVNGFFFISGILIVRSYVTRKNLGLFVRARICRIYPAWIVCMSIGVWGIGAHLTSLDFRHYLSHSETWEYFLRGLTLWNPGFFLPGLFQELRNHSINGSIWTLPAELRCYVFVGIAGVMGVFEKRRTANLLLAIVAIWGAWKFTTLPMVGENYDNLKPTAYFALGAFCFINAKNIPIHPLGLIPCLILYYFTFPHRAHTYAMALLLCYLIMVIVYNVPFVNLDKFGDLSYGVYLYAFPIQQMFAMLHPRWNAYYNFAASFPLTLCLAALSWHLVEKSFLKKT